MYFAVSGGSEFLPTQVSFGINIQSIGSSIQLDTIPRGNSSVEMTFRANTTPVNKDATASASLLYWIYRILKLHKKVSLHEGLLSLLVHTSDCCPDWSADTVSHEYF